MNMAGLHLLVYLKEGGPDLSLDYFKELLEPLREDELTNHPGMFTWIIDFAFSWEGKYCLQKKELPNLYTICPAFYTLESKWIERDYKNESVPDWEQKLVEYFNSVPDDTWLYLLYCKV